MNRFLIKVITLMTAVVLIAGCKKDRSDENPNATLRAGVYKMDNMVMFIYSTSRSGITNVAITGDFNNWKQGGLPMVYEGGVWKITLKLDYGIYQYKYILNGTENVPDPNAEAYSPDGRGGRNSIVEVVAESR